MPLATATQLEPRQIWNFLTPTSTSSINPHCTPFTLPSNGVIALNENTTITLTANVVFTPHCTGLSNSYTPDDPSTVADLRDPFYASTTPQIYGIAAATVIAWMLVILLIITPRTFFVGGPGSGSSFLNRHGIISGAAGWTTGGATVIGVGSRPWLQKLAAITVAISLTIATVDTFKVAEVQYDIGYMDAKDLRKDVHGSMEIRITRVICSFFVWLAQVQTLVRLFPRHKEKVVIKWVGFGLILLDIIFSCLKNFYVVGSKSSRPGRFHDAIPALNYLFALALSLLYAIWVIYYTLSKRRYAFYHPNMKNICVVALLSLISILMPVVFFVTDLAQPDAAGWGDYFTWVGSAAASVVVWEWVERIEALEREEKKDGILGREIFDGDEMLDEAPSQEIPKGGSSGFGGAFSSAAGGRGFAGLARRLTKLKKRRSKPRPHVPLGRMDSQNAQDKSNLSPGTATGASKTRAVPALPPAALTTPSRADTASAASTVYAVRYHTVSESLAGQQGNVSMDPNLGLYQPQRPEANPLDEMAARSSDSSSEFKEKHIEPEPAKPSERTRLAWQAMVRPFGRKRAASPAEVHNARKKSMAEHIESQQQTEQLSHAYPKWDIKSRLGALAAEQGERFRERKRGRHMEVQLPVTIIPAQPRGRTWSPMVLESEQTAIGSGSATPVATNGAGAGQGNTSTWSEQIPVTTRLPDAGAEGNGTNQVPDSQLYLNHQGLVSRGGLSDIDTTRHRLDSPHIPVPRTDDEAG